MLILQTHKATMTQEPRYDLHCHSTASDGVLPPADVVAAVEQGRALLGIDPQRVEAGQAEDVDGKRQRCDVVGAVLGQPPVGLAQMLAGKP